MCRPIKQFGNKTLRQLYRAEYDDDTFILEEKEKQSGLYFIVCPCDNPEYYYVKIGQAINVYKRLKQYQTYNPCLIHFGDEDFLPVEKDNLNLYEANCHAYLAKFAIGLTDGSHEWFVIKGTDFETICDSFATTLYGNRFLQIAKGLYK